jgi:hypothetical protein
MEWARILAYITGTVDQDLLLRNEYLAAENRILRGQLKGRLTLSDAERVKLGDSRAFPLTRNCSAPKPASRNDRLMRYKLVFCLAKPNQFWQRSGRRSEAF